MSLLQSNDFKDVVANDGRIVPPSSNLYKQLSVALDRTISLKYIYTILKLNRFFITFIKIYFLHAISKYKMIQTLQKQQLMH